MTSVFTGSGMRQEKGLKKRVRSVLGVSLVAVGLFSLTAPRGSAQAEMYVAGQIGVTLPHSITNIEGTGPNAGFSFSDASLQDSFMYGAKLGYYFESVKWLGVETEVFNSNPNLKQQNITVGGPGGSVTVPKLGEHLRVLNWSPITVVVRYQAGHFEPYVGMGMGVYFAHLSSGGESTSDTNVGLNTQLGLRYKVTQNLAVFGEWKTNFVKFHFDASTPNGNVGGFKGDYGANILAFGVGYHF
jgi:opacity protein-like surface antigen